jgi:hypothetical protein
MRDTKFNGKTQINLRIRRFPGSTRSSFWKRYVGEEVRLSEVKVETESATRKDVDQGPIVCN